MTSPHPVKSRYPRAVENANAGRISIASRLHWPHTPRHSNDRGGEYWQEVDRRMRVFDIMCGALEHGHVLTQAQAEGIDRDDREDDR